VTEPRDDDPVDDHQAEEDREISDEGLPHPGDARTDGGPVADDAALDEVFPPEGGRG
jgi:hypothetical protein